MWREKIVSLLLLFQAESNLRKGSYLSEYGKVSSSWKKEGTKISYEFEIPANCTAKIEFIDGSKAIVGPGKYHYEK
jgi:hypothetical protein